MLDAFTGDSGFWQESPFVWEACTSPRRVNPLYPLYNPPPPVRPARTPRTRQSPPP